MRHGPSPPLRALRTLPSLLAAFLLGVGQTACGDPGTEGEWRDDFTFPSELRGRWTADSPTYEGRTLELQADAVVFHTGGVFGISAHRIRRGRRVDAAEDGILYQIRYRGGSADELYSLDFYYSEEDGGRIRLENQPFVTWTPVEGPD